MMLERERSALVLVDYQQRLMPAIEAGEAAIGEAVFLARVARELGVPVLGTEQNPEGLGPNDERVRALCERTLAKTHFDATADALGEHLRSYGRPLDQVVVAGCEAHVCLMQTALGLLRQRLRVVVVAPACGSRRPVDKALAMQRLTQSGALPASPEMVAFEWLRDCTHPKFRTVLQLVKERPLSHSGIARGRSAAGGTHRAID
jgi:nicotinamidase-related amidase